MASGEMAPPMLPAMFMAPDSEPAFLPPTSMQVAQAPGMIELSYRSRMPRGLAAG